ncbi:hypothetical protein JCM9492_08870 [Aquifex pyrophilus]
MLRLFLLILLLIIFNILFSVYSLREWKEYTEMYFLYTKLTRENLVLLKKVEEKLSYDELIRYARKRGFKDVSPEDVKGFLEIYQPSGKSE